MKHDLKVTVILLAMFFATQMIGLLVINAYSPRQEIFVNQTTGQEQAVNVSTPLPYGMEPPQEVKVNPEKIFPSILISIVLATLIFLLLTKIKAQLVIKVWFISVVFITLSIALTAMFSLLSPSLNAIISTKYGFPVSLASVVALIVALPLTFYKIIKRNIIVHNITELLIYPGLAAVFVPLLNITFAIALLVLIAIYDMYAVWHSKIMVNMAKYQISQLKVFTGFFLPYMSKKAAEQLGKIKNIKEMKKLKFKQANFKKLSKKAQAKLKKIKLSLAILGGGDVAFPLIFAGVVMRAHSFSDALIISAAATLSLFLLFVYAKKEKFYPAMPFLSAGCIIGYLLSLLV